MTGNVIHVEEVEQTYKILLGKLYEEEICLGDLRDYAMIILNMISED
jgi:hypothetical protein